VKRGFAIAVAVCMVGGIAGGWLLWLYASPAQVKAVVPALGVVTDVFLRLIKMIIAPLVFTTLVGGVAHMEDGAAIGRVGAKTLGWFVGGSVISLAIGLVMVRLLHPGTGLHLHAASLAGAAAPGANLSLSDFITHLVPTSIADAMARNEILQIVVFAVLFGAAVAALEDRAPGLMRLIDEAARVMLKLTGFVMWVAPPAILCALASTVAQQGPSVLQAYAGYVGSFYLAIGVLWALMAVVGLAAVRRRLAGLVSAAAEPALIAFATTSSEAAYPPLLRGLERFGVAPRIAAFVLPLGYSFNLMGSMMYCTFAVLFIAQAYGIHLSLAQQVTMLLLLMVTSKGMAGVPRASLVVIAATLVFFHLPEGGLLLILGVDHLLDMGRSATNVMGNALASAVVARWEGELGEPVAAPESLGVA
jgi:Na+/H+-dicarboxylate symporter